MRRLLLDTNVVLDVLLNRKPHAVVSSAVWAPLEKGHGKGLVAAHAATTIHYLIGKDRGTDVARQALEAIMIVLDIAAVDGPVIQAALGLRWHDFEDAVTACAARAARCDAIVTRDPAGFTKSPVPAITPETAGAWLAQD